MSTKTYGVDVILTRTTGTLRKGRMSAVKTALMDKISAYDGTLTVIGAHRMKTYNYNAITSSLVSVRIGVSREQNLVFGNRTQTGYTGQYFLFNFTLHVFALHDTSDQLRAKTAQQLANGIIKYLRANNQDATSGIVDIFDLSFRESDPDESGARRLSRMIVEGKILAERPFVV